MAAKNEIVATNPGEGFCAFGKIYSYEGKEYRGVDLSGLADVTAADMIAVNRIMVLNGASVVGQELTMEDGLRMAARVLGMPYEFFERLSMADAFKVRREVQVFFND